MTSFLLKISVKLSTPMKGFIHLFIHYLEGFLSNCFFKTDFFTGSVKRAIVQEDSSELYNGLWGHLNSSHINNSLHYKKHAYSNI